MMFDSKKLCSTAEAAAGLEVSEPTVRRWCAEGKIQAIKKGGRWVVPQYVIDSFMGRFVYDHERALRDLSVSESSETGEITCKKCGRSWGEPQVCYWPKNEYAWDFGDTIGFDLLRMLCLNGCNSPAGFSEARAYAFRIGLLRQFEGDSDDDTVLEFDERFESKAKEGLKGKKGFIENFWADSLNVDFEKECGYDYKKSEFKFYVSDDSRYFMDSEIIDWLEEWYKKDEQRNKKFIEDLDSEFFQIAKPSRKKTRKGKRD